MLYWIAPRKVGIRVTGLGEFSPNGRSLTLGSYLKIAVVAQFLGYSFLQYKLCINLDTTRFWLHFGRFFTHLVSLVGIFGLGSRQWKWTSIFTHDRPVICISGPGVNVVINIFDDIRRKMAFFTKSNFCTNQHWFVQKTPSVLFFGESIFKSKKSVPGPIQ
jgi:hypothetical protein